MVEIMGPFAKMVGIDDKNLSASDTETLFVGKLNGSHVEISRIFSREKMNFTNEKPKTGDHYPCLISFSSGRPNIYLDATIISQFHDEGALYAKI